MKRIACAIWASCPTFAALSSMCRRKRQTLFFSATMPDEIRTLADSILTNPATVQIGTIAPAKTVSHALYPVADSHKNKLLLAMLEQIPTQRVLVFTRTKRRARNLAQGLENAGYRVSALQGNMAQNQRQKAINGFRDGKYDILVATDIASRGIDVTEISHVINYDMPDTVDAYTHRIGRTGRAEQAGEAFTFVGQTDEQMVREIEKVLGSRIERRKLAGTDYMSSAADGQAQLRESNGARPTQAQGNSSRNGSGASGGGRHKASTGGGPYRTSTGGDTSRSTDGRRRRPQRRRRYANPS